MLKLIKSFIIIICCVNLTIAQEKVISNKSLKQQKEFINSFPKSIKNQNDFVLAIRTIESFNPILLQEYNFINETKTVIIPLQQAITWSEKKATVNEQMICYKMYFLITENLLYYSEKIITANALLLHQDLLNDKEINRLIISLNYGYLKLDAYNEIIKLIPIRKKYAHLNAVNNTDATIEYDLAIALYKTKNYKRAITSFLKRKSYYQKITDALYVSSMSNNVGLCYYKLQNFPKALEYFNTALEELKEAKENQEKKIAYFTFFKSVILSNIAYIDIENKNYNKAIFAYNNLVQKTKIAGEKENIPEGYLNLAKVYFRINKIKLAKIYLDSTANNYFNALSVEKKIDYNITKAKIELLNGNINTASKLFDLSKKINDSSLIEQSKRESILAETKYNFEEKDKALQVIKFNFKAKEKVGLYQKIGLIVTLILLLIIAILFYKNVKRRKLINQQNIVLKENLKEKEVLLKEIHHRVKNNLQVISGLLNLQAKKTKSDEVIELLKHSERQINSIAIVHQMLYQFDEFSFIKINDYFEKLIAELKDSYANQNITYKINVANMYLSSNITVPLGLIISELITNSYKHAFDKEQGNITINLIETAKNEIELMYEDSGKGFIEKQTNTNSKSMGLTLLKMLAEEINGTLQIDGDKKLKATIKFKYEN